MTLPGSRTIVCDVRLAEPDAATIDRLARLRLAARRGGLELRLRGVSNELRELIAFTGLDGVLRGEPRREAEQWEQRVGVEEERELDDAPP
jgi:hypothetical protein